MTERFLEKQTTKFVEPTDKSKYLNAPDSPGAPRTHRA